MPIFSPTESRYYLVFLLKTGNNHFKIQNQITGKYANPRRYCKISHNNLPAEIVKQKFQKWIHKLPYYNKTNIIYMFDNKDNSRPIFTFKP